MAIHNENYNEILGLLGDMYVKYIDINNSVTTIPIDIANPLTPSGTVQIDDEKITYTGIEGTNLTGCTRGAESTSATNHSGSGFGVTQI